MLNDALFKKLVDLFGDVVPANEGEPLIITRRRDYAGTVKLHKEQGGEEYRINCPMCGDTKHRMYINHAWGLDRQTGYPSSKLVVCHNEHCEDNDDRNKPFRGNIRIMLEQKLRSYTVGSVPKIDMSARKTEAPKEPLPFPDPAWTVPFEKLDPKHPALKFLRQRKFTIAEMNKWGVVYAEQYPVTQGNKEYFWLAERLFIPCGRKGWQARTLEENTKTMKYFTCPGWKKSREVYNIEEARKYTFCVLCEGVTDVWRVGPQGICIFGKSLANHQVEAIAKQFDTVALALDPDAYTGGEKAAGIKSANLLRRHVRNVSIVQLPGGRDPSDCSRETLWKCIYKALGERAKIAAR